MKLSKRKHKINYGAEGLPPVRRFITFVEKKISFIIYYAIIFSVLFVVLSSGWQRIAYINGNGIINKSLIRLRADSDLYIESFAVDDGDSVTTGDPLCYWTGAHSKYYRKSGAGNKSLDRKLVTLKVSLNEKRAKREELRKAHVDLLNRLKKCKNQLSLELKPDENIVTLDNLITTNRIRDSRLIQEIEDLKKTIAEVMSLMEVEKESDDSLLNETILDEGVYSSKWNGEIHQIFVHSGEYVKDGEDIMNITSCGNVHISAFFKMKHLEFIKVNKKVDIVLPNNKKRKGTIVKVFKTSEHLPSEFKKSYDISRPRIYAHIESDDSISCNLIDGMTVRVLMKRELPWK